MSTNLVATKPPDSLPATTSIALSKGLSPPDPRPASEYPDAALRASEARRSGRIRKASFTDHFIPTTLDMRDVTIAAREEEPEPGAPFGAKGIGEPPTISSSAAVRDATGLPLPRIPIRPADIALS